MNIIKDAAIGTKNLGSDLVSNTIEGVRASVMGTIKDISSWTWNSMWKLLAGTGKMAWNGIASSRVIPGIAHS